MSEPGGDSAEGNALRQPTRAQRILAEQIRIIILQTPQGVAAPGAMAAISAAVLWNDVALLPLLVTLGLLFASLLWWLTYYLEYKRRNPPATEAPGWARGALLRTAAQGCCWGAYSLVIFVPDSVSHQSFTVAFMYGLVAGAVVVDGPHFRTFLAFAIPTLLPVIVRCFLEGTPTGTGIGIAGLVGLLHSVFAALNGGRIMENSIRTRFENQDLVLELDKQRQAADLARAHAEAANLGKSRFLAAASHDLRQPVHALGLFATAAKRAGTDQERQRIIDRIDESVVSLSELFDSLIEVSRLDAGILQPQVKAVSLAAILGKLAAEYAPEARERNLDFRLRCADLAIRTDPILLERIVRNLLTNALRYTRRGGILLSGRKRGNCARIEVWDTGVGIAPANQAQVFEEFYQIGNPERDHRNGVGLGLAIVKRVASLLQHPLHLASRVGRGSRFAIDVELSAAPDEQGVRPPPPVDESVLLGTLIVVIDDEPDILAAVTLVLKQFGCAVTAAESGARAKQLLEAEGRVPDLILSDFRLRGGENGVEAIDMLRTGFGEEIPAVIVTGDTAVERLEALRASGVEVLHKPIGAEPLKQVLIRLLA